MSRVPQPSEVVAVGIDVAKASLSVCLRFHDGTECALSISNVETDINAMAQKYLQGYAGKVIVESTGHYHWLTALLLSDAGMDVRVVNPILAKQYTSGSSIRKVKTDKADARGLAQMALLEERLPVRFSQTRDSLMLRKKLSFISFLTTKNQSFRAAEKSLTEAISTCGGELSKTEAEIMELFDALHRKVGALEREFEEEVAEGETSSTHELLADIPGVSNFVAALALHWFSSANGETPKSWVAYAGLDVSVRESGTWQGKCRLTKRGDSFLRRRLFSAAWGAVRNDQRFNGWYLALREDGHAYVETMLIIARKLVRTMHHVATTKEAYDPQKCFKVLTDEQTMSTPL